MAASGFAKLFSASFVTDIYSSDFADGAPAALDDANNAIKAAEAKGDFKAKVAGLLRLADVHLKQKDSKSVESVLDEAGKLCRRLKFDEGKAYMLIMQAKLELWYGSAEEAVSWSRDALKLFKKDDNDRATAFASNVHAFVLSAAGKAQEGMSCAKEALQLYQKLGEKTLEVGLLRLLMDMFTQAGDTLRAGLVGWEIVKVVSESGGEKKHKVKLAEIIQSIANIEFQGNDLEKAMAAAEEACSLYQKAGNAEGEAAMMKVMMNVYLKKDKFYEGIEVAKAIVQLYHEAGLGGKFVGGALMDLATVYMHGDSYDEATVAASQADQMFKMAQDADGMKLAETMLQELSMEQRKRNIKVVLEMNRHRLGHIPTNLVIAPDGLDTDAINNFGGGDAKQKKKGKK